MPKKTKASSARGKRPSTQLRDLRPARISGAEARLVKGGQELPPEKRRQIARDT